MTDTKQLIKLMNRLLRQEHLFSSEQLVEFKRKLRVAKQELMELEVKTSKGFGKK